jgi:hypothetical protein
MTAHWIPPAATPEASLSNLLDNCLGLARGQSLLIVAEPGTSFYRGNLAAIVAQAAEARGATVTIRRELPVAGPEDFPTDLKDEIARSNHTIFFARLGSTARFVQLPGKGSKVVSYTLDEATFFSPFAALPYDFVQDLHDAIVAKITTARHYRLTCPNGTDLSADLPPGASGKVIPFSVKNFPLMIVPPITAATASGRLALTLALLPTSTHVYDDSILPLETPLLLEIEHGRITGFGGNPEQARRAEAQFDRVGALFAADSRQVGSWHTGINPGTFFAAPALSDLQRWGNAAFGSPRYTHFHMVGSDPGDICGSLFDATILFDDEPVWQDGRLAFLDSSEGQTLIARHGVDPAQVAVIQPIGL